MVFIYLMEQFNICRKDTTISVMLLDLLLVAGRE